MRTKIDRRRRELSLAAPLLQSIVIPAVILVMVYWTQPDAAGHE